MDKAHFRKLTNSILSKSANEITLSSPKISENLLDVLRQNKPYRKVLFFYPTKDEPQIQNVISESLKDGSIYLPRMEGDRIVPVEITSVNDLELVENWGPKWGPIPTPKKTCPLADLSTIDIVVIPGRAFDKYGVRIGRGKGHYDRFLPQITALKIGVAFHFQIFGKLPSEPHDILMDMVITEKIVLERAI